MIEIREVNNKKEIRRFLKFTEKHYKDNPYYVPELYMDNKKMFKKNYMYFDQAETVFYNAYKDNVSDKCATLIVDRPPCRACG